MTMTTISVRRAQRELPTLAKRTAKRGDGNVTMITKDGTPTLVLMSVKHFEELTETIECLSDKSLMASLRQGLAELAAGHAMTEEEADAAIGW